MVRALRAMLYLLALQVGVVDHAWADVVVSGSLARQADLGFVTETVGGQVVIGDVTPRSAAAVAGVQAGDVVSKVDGVTFDKPYEYAAALERLKADAHVTLVLERAGKAVEVSFDPPPRAFETLAGLDSYHGVVATPDGARLRTIITVPSGTTKPLPALFFVQWVGCDTVQFLDEGPWIDAFRGVAERSGRAFIRIERSANGDSEGPACHELDFETELAQYRYAFEEVAKDPRVDPASIAIIANSLGSFMAPFVAEGKPVSGMVITSGGGLSYFERMVEFDRRYLSHPGKPAAAIHDQLMRQVVFNTKYLLQGLSPDEIIRQDPGAQGTWDAILGSGDGTHYGRPYRFHQQAARRNALSAWERICAPVLVLHGEFDQYESIEGAQAIVETVNEARPGTASLEVLQGLGHSFYKYPTMADAYSRANREPAGEEVAAAVIAWLDKEQALTGHDDGAVTCSKAPRE